MCFHLLNGIIIRNIKGYSGKLLKNGWGLVDIHLELKLFIHSWSASLSLYRTLCSHSHENFAQYQYCCLPRHSGMVDFLTTLLESRRVPGGYPHKSSPCLNGSGSRQEWLGPLVCAEKSARTQHEISTKSHRMGAAESHYP